MGGRAGLLDGTTVLWWMKDFKYKMRDVVEGRDGILLLGWKSLNIK
jgi:hypothetical protein